MRESNCTVSGILRSRFVFLLMVPVLHGCSMASAEEISHSSSGQNPAREAPPAPGEAESRGPSRSRKRQRTGRWRPMRHFLTEDQLTEEQKEQIEELRSIGYLRGSRPAPSRKGVTVFDEDAAYDGLNLYVSGHAPEAILMDMKGKVLHTWSAEYASVWPGRPRVPQSKYWRRAHLFDNGDLLAIYEGYGLIRLDKDSNLLWAHDRNSHHDLDITSGGRIYVLDREIGVVPRIATEKPIVEDYVTVLDPDGVVLNSVSILQCFENSFYAPILRRTRQRGDLFHTNTLEVLDGRHAERCPIFRKGNVLVSLRYLDTIAILDLEEETVVWALVGMWHRQHQPTLLENGRMLLFDNNGYRDHSKVIEFDPLTQEITWFYVGDPPDTFFTNTCGSCQRLPNGNTLITESDRGRAFEVACDGTMVWEFLNPRRAGENKELIATLFEVVRLAPDFPLDWLEPKAVQAHAGNLGGTGK